MNDVQFTTWSNGSSPNIATGWCWLEPDFDFSIYYNHPNWQTHTFQRSWNHQPDTLKISLEVSGDHEISKNQRRGNVWDHLTSEISWVVEFRSYWHCERWKNRDHNRDHFIQRKSYPLVNVATELMGQSPCSMATYPYIPTGPGLQVRKLLFMTRG